MAVWSLKNDYAPIALDLGRSTVRMLQFKRVGRGLQLPTCAARELSSEAMLDDGVWRQEAISAVRAMLVSNEFHGKMVATALPCDQLMLQNCRLAKMSRERLEKAIRQEAEKRTDGESVPAEMNYVNAGDVRVGGEVYQEIITLGATQEIIEAHVALLGDMGLKPVHIDSAPTALFHVFERHLRRQEDTDTVTAVVEVGFSGTRVVVASGPKILFLKSIDIGGKHFTEAVARQAGLNFDEAYQLRQRLIRSERSGLPDLDDSATDHDAIRWSVHDALRSQVQNLAKEVSLCLRYCSVTFRGLGLRQVQLVGGESRDPMFTTIFREALSMECVETDPFQRVDIAPVAFAEGAGELAQWAVCAGLGFYAAETPVLEKEAGHDSCRISA
jgi:type IV pilus assembly protein PilM